MSPIAWHLIYSSVWGKGTSRLIINDVLPRTAIRGVGVCLLELQIPNIFRWICERLALRLLRDWFSEING